MMSFCGSALLWKKYHCVKALDTIADLSIYSSSLQNPYITTITFVEIVLILPIFFSLYEQTTQTIFSFWTMLQI